MALADGETPSVCRALIVLLQIFAGSKLLSSRLDFDIFRIPRGSQEWRNRTLVDHERFDV